MERIITGSSVYENFITGVEFYGELGNLIGVVDLEGNSIAVIKNKQGEYIYRDAVIDASVSISKKGPVVNEQIFLGNKEKQFNMQSLNLLNNSLETMGNLDLFGNGEINVDLGLQQSENTVYVAEEDFLNYLKTCKRMYPELPLIYSIEMMPYEKTSSKAM